MEFEIYIFQTTQNKHFIVVEADCYNVDYGIGAYEYWGFKGYDSIKVLECDIEVVYLIQNKNTGRRRKINFSALSKEIQEEIKNKTYQQALALSKEYSGD